MMKRGSALLGTLVTVALILILAVIFLKGGCGSNLSVAGKSNRADGKGITVLGASEAAARDDVCRSDLSQIRQSIQIYNSSDDSFPASLKELKLGDSFLKCPVGHEEYVYDPQTGAVHCPHPGHEKY